MDPSSAITSVAIDNGGTKAVAIRYDGNFRPVASVRTGSLREATNTKETVEKRVCEIIDGLGIASGDFIDLVSGTFPRVFSEKFREQVNVGEFRYYYEYQPGLAAAELFGDALYAICGTGVSAFARVDGNCVGVGGYGSLISDEGSGYWIAREAFGAAIRDFEGRGPRTALTRVISEKYGEKGREGLRNAIFNVYGRQQSVVTEIASLTPLVVKTAESDSVASEILQRAGCLVAEQLVTAGKEANAPDGIPVSFGGSVWKNDPVFCDAFTETLKLIYPGSEIIPPRYEPVVGSIMLGMAEKNKQTGVIGLTDRDRQILEEFYRDQAFPAK